MMAAGGPDAALKHLRDLNSPDMRHDIGAAHPGGMPSLFADGSVRTLRYTTSETIICFVEKLGGGQEHQVMRQHPQQDLLLLIGPLPGPQRRTQPPPDSHAR
jgi:prepilin-type processing-associated H-X9-DG protein